MAEPPSFPRLRYVDAFPTEVEGEPRVCLRDPLGYSDKVIVVPYPVFFLLTLLDGTNSIQDIQTAFVKKYGQILFRERVEEIVRALDESLFLDGERFRNHKQSLVEAFRAAEVREAIHAGGAYEAAPEALRAMLRSFFEHGDGPGARSSEPHGASLRGLIAPHIDPRRGGPCYAHAYGEVARLAPADTYVIFGTSHAPMERLFAVTRKPYDTPFGRMEIDSTVIDTFEKRLGSAIYQDEFNHRAEHSIEFQAVFLAYLFDERSRESRPRIVPILCGSLHRQIESGERPGGDAEFAEFTAALKEAISGRSVCLVAGADLAHVGLKFGDREAPTESSLATLEAEDVAMMRALETLDADGFFRSVHEDQDRRRICGLSPILALMAALDAREGKLLRYGQFPEHDTGSVVTFASMAFYG